MHSVRIDSLVSIEDSTDTSRGAAPLDAQNRGLLSYLRDELQRDKRVEQKGEGPAESSRAVTARAAGNHKDQEVSDTTTAPSASSAQPISSSFQCAHERHHWSRCWHRDSDNAAQGWQLRLETVLNQPMAPSTEMRPLSIASPHRVERVDPSQPTQR